MTDTSNVVFNDEINGGMPKIPKMISKGIPSMPSMPLISSTAEYVHRKSDFFKILFGVNFALRLCLLIFSFSSQFKGKNYYIDQYKKHVKESIGITIIISAIFLYMYSIAKDVLRGKRKDCIQFTIFTLILFSIFMYDYVNIVLMLVDTKYFSKDNKNKGILSGIMLAIIFGIFVLYYLTIALCNRKPFYPFASKTVYQFAFIQGSIFLVLLFMLSFIGFFIVNINKIDFNESNPFKAIWGSIANSEENRLNNNQKKTNDRKEFFIDMFKKYYMIFILIFCILLVVLDLNRIEFYSFVESIYPCPPTQTE